jgi:4-hydroxymandelate oxidase
VIEQPRQPLAPLSQIPPQIAAVADYEAYARERMSDSAWAWLSGGAADELTLRENREAFDRLKLQNRVLADLKGGGTGLSLFGLQLDYPIVLAPVAYHRLAHPQGELASALGASAIKAAMVVSTQASIALEDIAQAAQTPLWFQLYMQPEREHTLALLRRAEAAGYRAIVLTLDAPVNGVRNREQRAGFQLPPGIDAPNLRDMPTPALTPARAGESALFGKGLLDAAPTWDDLAWLRAATTLPLIVKGITSPLDAVQAIDCGVDGIVVSNHGGRVLDGQPATIDALPAVAQAVAGRVPLLLDGGIRRGTDILKALALGASAVMIGRPYVHGLAAAGAVGVVHVVHMLRTELEIAMALTGCRTLAEITPAVIWSKG